jgi:hypothetical protein
LSPDHLFGQRDCLQSGELLSGLLEIHRIVIGVGPHGKEVLIGIDSASAIAFGGKGTSELEPGQRVEAGRRIKSLIRQDAAEVFFGERGLACGKVGKTPAIGKVMGACP